MPEVTINSNEVAPEKLVDVKVNLRPPLEFKLPDGRKIEMSKPMEPSAMFMPAVMASMVDPNSKEAPNPIVMTQQAFVAKVVMFVRSIDGKPFRQPSSMTEVNLIVRELGEDGYDLVYDVFLNHFVPPSASQLEIIKK